MNFGINKAATDSSEEAVFNKTMIIENDQIHIVDNNVPSAENELDTDSASTSLPAAAMLPSSEQLDEHLRNTRQVMFNLSRELVPLVGRSDEMAAKVKLANRYLNMVTEALAPSNSDAFAKLQVLQHFPEYVNQLEQAEDGERSVEHLLMRVLLEKHGLFEESRKIRDELNRLREQ